MDAVNRPAAKRDTRSGGRRSAPALDTDWRGFGKQILPKHISGVVRSEAGFSGSGRTREAAPSAGRVAAGWVMLWSSAWSLGTAWGCGVLVRRLR